jgi:hypothetical protein
MILSKPSTEDTYFSTQNVDTNGSMECKKASRKNYRDEVAFASVLSVLRLLLPMFKSSRILSAE